MESLGLTISCDECSMRCTAACADCVVTYLLSERPDHEQPLHELLDLDRDQVRVVRLFGDAGMVPGLRYREAG